MAAAVGGFVGEIRLQLKLTHFIEIMKLKQCSETETTTKGSYLCQSGNMIFKSTNVKVNWTIFNLYQLD